MVTVLSEVRPTFSVRAGSSILVASILGACMLLGAGPRTFEVTMQRGEAAIAVTVVDESSLIAGVVGEVPPTRGFRLEPDAFMIQGRPTELIVVWSSGLCSTSPLVRLSADARSITVDPRDDGKICPGAAVENGVTLVLKQAVAPAEIRVTMVE